MTDKSDERKALEELVACKDLKERIGSFSHTPECLAGPWQACPQELMQQEYDRRQPLAWANARAVLATAPAEPLKDDESEFGPVLLGEPDKIPRRAPPKDGEVAALIEREPLRVHQTTFGKYGDCFACCVATLMGVDLSEIPPEVSSAAQFTAIRKWALTRGWRVVTLAINEEVVKGQLAQGYVIVSGKSSRGLPHAVIFKDGKLWHDPHPSLDGVEVIDEVDLFMPLNPALARLSAPVPAREWIPVGERLPTHNYSVLAAVIESPNHYCNAAEPLRDVCSYLPKERRWIMSDGDVDITVKVSHWQDIPPPPAAAE